MGATNMGVSGNELSEAYLKSVKARFAEMKKTAEKALEQLDDESLFWAPNSISNSISVIIKHVAGHMLSRWTDTLHTDGEKPDRNRAGEFEETRVSKAELIRLWDSGWKALFAQLDTLNGELLLSEIRVSGSPLTLLESIEKSVYHYGYHIGQIVYIAKQVKETGWTVLTVPTKKDTPGL